ncbi:hypothetical protein S-MbCM100_022 [Synechococcus phage S-MbCM100]|uniref:Uncharacterized protein n=2 Tax=Acionnavirus monteraybay TaxID=2734078 RepID=A0A0E3G7U9_9CAUD|nr:hypothetical protein S-MbCM100_022 [Synechococcus phage S-MbCM100]AIX14203.1 hypothetical protein Syn7803C42_18 [Synechococcus phage ACG-2014a]AHB80872.1 hypothetical protein S-MbCM100_022 [Synechococcus phage S-MbCM100]AIX15067.1 hypothetical protein Syn7803C47_18 [Synechococcus phage ACG-2014a]AIX15715.1 hypothetical protein Syn7803C53_18 [Synechococcus phage ACG-2014a]AIX16825.1 hypothetical protein Syn7803C59_18 [Synechococcus phage ACG-2014a]
MSDTLSHVFVNFSKRKITLLDEEGYEKDVRWNFNSIGSEGFSETVSQIQEILDPDMITYCFAAE